MKARKEVNSRRCSLSNGIARKMPRKRVKKIPLFVAIMSVFSSAGKISAQGAAHNETAKSSLAQNETELTRLWSYGWDHYRNKRYAQAPEYFWKVAQLDTAHRFKQVYNYLGVAYFTLGKLDSAQLAYQKGVQVFPSDLDLRRNLAYVFAARDQIEDALATYEQIEQIAALNRNDLRRMVPLYQRAQREDEAVRTLERLSALEPEDETVRETLAGLYKARGEEHKALRSMEETVARHPDDRQALFALAQARFDRREYEIALPLLQRYCVRDSVDAYARTLVARAQRHLGKYREALASYDAALKLQPQQKKVWVEISGCLRALNEYAAARRAAQKALQIDAKFGEALLALGQVYEAGAEACAADKGRRDFNDKLVYRMAYEQYQRAREDLNTRAEAQQRMDSLLPLLPTKEDEFMNKNQERPQGDCYSWLNQ